VGVLAGVLFAVNVIARLAIRLADGSDSPLAERASLGMFVVIGLILAVEAFRRGRREPVGAWGADVGLAVLVAMLLTVLVGPFVSGSAPFADGAGEFFAQIWLYLAAAGAGTLLGYLLLTALGRDHRSETLRRYAESSRARPRRVVRR
jgi:hypothetical protein